MCVLNWGGSRVILLVGRGCALHPPRGRVAVRIGSCEKVVKRACTFATFFTNCGKSTKNRPYSNHKPDKNPSFPLKKHEKSGMEDSAVG